MLGGAENSLLGGDFIAPAEGPVAFRRDQVPLDSDTMSTLSKHLATLAQGLDLGTDESFRTVAQMLALATALDPGNGRARDLLSEFKKGNSPHSSDQGAFEKSRDRIWKAIAWLERPEAGSQGRALASCLLDIIIVADPRNPRTEALRAEGERGAWAGWVPLLADYRPKVEIKPKPEDRPPRETPFTQPSIGLTKALVSTVLWKNVSNDDSPKWIQVSAPLRMKAEVIQENDDHSSQFSLIIGPESDYGPVQGLAPTILQLLKKQHNNLPAGQRVKIAGDSLEMSMRSGKRQSISAAAAVLASAAISGREPDATIIGTVDSSGNFKLPSGFWNQLLALSPGYGGRLVLPAAAADYLPSMLALGKPQFFMDYEVLLAADFKELLEMSAKTPSEPMANAKTQFREIREKMGTQPLGQYVANSFVRRRLVDLYTAAPYHFSAKMLAIQGAGNRPAFLPKVVLGAEIRIAIEPLNWIIKMDSTEFDKSDLDRLESSYETCRTQLERLVRYAEKKDQILITHAQELLPKVRTLERTARSRGEYYPSYEAVLRSQKDLSDACDRLTDELAAGE